MPTMTLDHHADTPPLEPGDYLGGSTWVYRILAVRPVESRQWPERWRYTTERVLTRGQIAEQRWRPEVGRRLVNPVTYRPGERPGEPMFQACADQACDGCRGAR